MSCRKMVCVMSFLICLLALNSVCWASTWYVRPAGGSYGLENGTSYDNAWDGFGRIVWGSSGVTAGDTLYVCGNHYQTMTVGATGASGSPITIRGDYAISAGVIDGSADIKTGKSAYWTETSTGSNKWYYSNGYSNYVLLNDKFAKRVYTLDGMDQDGEWYYSNPYIYIYSTTNPADSTTFQTIRVGHYSKEYGIKIDSKSYVTVRNL
ncbi:MAG: hypothetical protein PHT33_04770, partial [bacterium]|nr:hypothetical protein [bacterium]